jgi:predicted transcriptional regulator
MCRRERIQREIIYETYTSDQHFYILTRELIDQGLLQNFPKKGSQDIYLITDKGRKFVELYDKMLDESGLRKFLAGEVHSKRMEYRLL